MKRLLSWLKKIQGIEQELLPNLSTNKSSFSFLVSLDGNDIQKSTTKSCLNHQTRPETMIHVACHLCYAVRPRGSSRVVREPKDRHHQILLPDENHGYQRQQQCTAAGARWIFDR